MAEKRPALGRGLSALIPEAAASAAGRDKPFELDLDRLVPNPQQPRSVFDETKLEELAQSIRASGMIQPIIARRARTLPGAEGLDRFEIIAGERRWRAAQRAGLMKVPVVVRDVPDERLLEAALIENIQREDLNAIEEAEGYKQLIDHHGHSPDDIGRLVHKSRSHVANLLRLLDLPQFVRDTLVRGDISKGHARAVATALDPEGLAKEIIAKGLSVRQTEARARKEKRPPPELQLTERRGDPDLVALERQLGDMLGVRVKVAHNGAAGTVTLHYSSLDQLDMICQRLSGEPI